MSTRIPPPWIKTAASKNIAKRARARAILKEKGLLDDSKEAARVAIHDGMQHWVGEIEKEVAAQAAKNTKFSNRKKLR